MRLLTRIFLLTRREYFADFFITPPLTILAAYWSLQSGIDLRWMAMLLIGIACWTLYEYSLHRWMLHGPLACIHRLHHRDPKDYVALHPLATLALYGTSWFLLGARSSALAVGFSSGYVAYAVLHTAFHYQWRLASMLSNVAHRHVLHHRIDGVNYGVLTSAWDRLFRTECS